VRKKLGTWKKFLFSLFITFFLFGLIVIVIEIWLRTQTCLGARPTAYPNIADQYVGWYGQPGMEIVRSLPTTCSVYRYNNLGFRGPDRSLAKPDGVMRILVLGDSFVEGYQLPDDQLMTTQLERILTQRLARPVEVINMGISGWGTAQEVLAYNRFGRALQPDIVILMFATCNDIINSSQKLSKIYNEKMEPLKPFFTLENNQLQAHLPDEHLVQKSRALAEVNQSQKREAPWEKMIGIKRLLCRTRLGYLLWTRWDQPSQLRLTLDRWKIVPFSKRIFRTTWGEHGFYRGLSLRFWIYYPEIDPIWQAAVQVSGRMILRLKDMVEEDHARLLLVSGANIEQVDKDIWKLTQRLQPTIRHFKLDLNLPEKRMKIMTENQKIQYLSLVPDFRQAASEGRELFLRGDGHWNKEGHLVAAEAIAEYLEQTAYLTTKRTGGQSAD